MKLLQFNWPIVPYYNIIMDPFDFGHRGPSNSTPNNKIPQQFQTQNQTAMQQANIGFQNHGQETIGDMLARETFQNEQRFSYPQHQLMKNPTSGTSKQENMWMGNDFLDLIDMVESTQKRGRGRPVGSTKKDKGPQDQLEKKPRTPQPKVVKLPKEPKEPKPKKEEKAPKQKGQRGRPRKEKSADTVPRQPKGQGRGRGIRKSSQPNCSSTVKSEQPQNSSHDINDDIKFENISMQDSNEPKEKEEEEVILESEEKISEKQDESVKSMSESEEQVSEVQVESVEEWKVQNLKPMTKDAIEQFFKLNSGSVAWQQQQQQLNKHKGQENSPTKQDYLVAQTQIHPKFKVYLIEKEWLDNVRNYASEVNQILIELAQALESQNKCSKSKPSKKKSNDAVGNTKQRLEKALKDLALKFATTCKPLQNKGLILASPTFKSKMAAFNYSFTSKEKEMNVFLKQNVCLEDDFELVLPQFHDFLVETQSRKIFNIDTEEYIPVARRYIRLDGRQALKTELEVHYIQIFLNSETHSICSQISVDWSVKQVLDRLQILSKEVIAIKKKEKLMFALQEETEELIELKPERISFKLLFSDHLRNKKQTVRIKVFRASKYNELKLLEVKQVFANCDYCRGSLVSSKNQAIICQCKEVRYCSKRCAHFDKPFHNQLCLRSYNKKEEWNYDRTDINLLKPVFFERMGLVGLYNTSNSCYLNCTLQCLSQCKALTNYFLKGLFIEEMNTQNPLGCQGMLSIAYAQIIKQLWSGEIPVVVPLNFKSVLSRFKKQFANNDQQDSQELLTILLDSLHEDLNRVKIKPLVPTIESHGEDDVKASKESWEAHLKRSQSIIVDLMHGQFKSTVRCPEEDCNHLSITFEPFMNISLPIPEIKLITKYFIWVPADVSQKCSMHQFTIKGHESIKNLRRYLTEEILTTQGICDNENQFEIVLIKQDKVVRIMCQSNQAIGLQNQNTHLFLFETGKKVSSEQTITEEDLAPQIQSKAFVEGQYMQEPPSLPIGLEIKSRLQNRQLMTILNFEIIDHSLDQLNTRQVRNQTGDDVENLGKESYFPRLTYLDLDASLIQIHLMIFKKLRYLFTRFLELREWYFHNTVGSFHQHGSSSIEDSLFMKKMSMKIPLHINLEKWNNMSLTEQYEIVFSCQQNFKDPSRRKPQDLPYFIRIVSRKVRSLSSPQISSGGEEYENFQGGPEQSRESHDSHRSQKPCTSRNPDDLLKCIYCKRKNCSGCPLPFEDKVSLSDFLQRCKAPLQSTFYFQDDDTYNQMQTNQKKQKKQQDNSKRNEKHHGTQKKNSKSKGNAEPHEPEENELDDENMDLEIVVQINKNNCWGLHELLIRGQNQKLTFMNSIMKLKQAKQEQFLEKQKSMSSRDSQFFVDKVTISDCFRQFDRPEKLSWQNEWYCDQCKAHKQAYKKIQVYKTPPILIITLKRFKGNMTNQKQNTPVYYPIDGLNMKNFMISQGNDQVPTEDLIYDLFGVVIHTGSLNGGHYTAVVKNADSWYEFNDHQVIKISKHDTQKIISNHAYILFYQKRGIDYENIIDYSKIRNALKTDADGQERFNPDQIEFPSIQEEKVQEPIRAEKCDISQIDLFDQDMLTDCHSFKEVNYVENQSYLEWLEKDMDLDQFLFDQISEIQSEKKSPQIVPKESSSEDGTSSASEKQSLKEKREQKYQAKQLILKIDKQSLPFSASLTPNVEVIEPHKSPLKQSEFSILKETVASLIRINKLSNISKKRMVWKLKFDIFLNDVRPKDELPQKKGKKKQTKDDQSLSIGSPVLQDNPNLIVMIPLKRIRQAKSSPPKKVKLPAKRRKTSVAKKDKPVPNQYSWVPSPLRDDPHLSNQMSIPSVSNFMSVSNLECSEFITTPKVDPISSVVKQQKEEKRYFYKERSRKPKKNIDEDQLNYHDEFFGGK